MIDHNSGNSSTEVTGEDVRELQIAIDVTVYYRKRCLLKRTLTTKPTKRSVATLICAHIFNSDHSLLLVINKDRHASVCDLECPLGCCALWSFVLCVATPF